MIRLVLAAAVALCAAPAVANDIFVSSASDIATAMQSAQPGDTLVMTNGVWTDQNIRFQGNGTAAQPITLRAQTPGEVILTGSSTLEMSGQHLVVDGLYFRDGVLGEGDHVIQFRRGSALARNCRLTNTIIENVNNPDVEVRFFWVSMYGADNTVDNCRFEGFVNRGVTLVVWGDWPNRHIIERNHFIDRPEYAGPNSSNGFETVRIGTSSVSLSSSQSIVRSNLFERCNGETEIISSKTGDNSYIANTFLDSVGTLTLRHGNGALVSGNFFIGNGITETGGVRIIGEDHIVENNYFENLDGRAGGIIVFEAAQPDPELFEYAQVVNARVVNNTIVNPDTFPIRLDGGLGSDGRTELPINSVIANNAVSAPGETLVRGGPVAGITWRGNQFFGSSLGFSPTPSGVSLLGQSPLQLGVDGLQRPAAGSPLLNAANPADAPATDMDGQARDASPDVGSDEVSGAPVISRPLTEADVGPDWLNEPPTPAQIDDVIIPAELAELVLDPDGDGQTWTVVAEPSAITGAVLKAPSTGGRVDRPGETHDSIARFTTVFDAPGSYTAYVRSRGFSGSTDSFYIADALGIDPEINQASSNTGSFRWNAPVMIDVTPADVGEPRSITIGKREEDTEIDAIILSPDAGLSDAELDQLVTSNPRCDADLDRDGSVDFLDYSLFLQWYEAADLAADLTGDGAITNADESAMRSRIDNGCP
ncbi:MAG: chondroitinase-B domain-containing protein [Planctomycetota bacterium]